MTAHANKPIYKRNPFVGPNELTLADVARHLKDDAQLPSGECDEIADSIDAIGTALGVKPAMVPARGRDIRHAHQRICRASDAAGKSAAAKQYRDVMMACRYLGIDMSGRGPTKYLDADWLRLWEQLTVKRDQSVLARLIQFCSANGIGPEDVGDETVVRLRAACLVGAFAEYSSKLTNCVEKTWNRQVDKNPQWPRQRLTPPDFGWRGKALPLDRFPASFQQDVEAYLAWISDRDPLLKDPPPRICGPATIRQRRTNLRLAASALVDSGRLVAHIDGLTDLVEPDAFQAILREYLARKNGEPSVFIRELARLLFNIARYWVRAEKGHLDQLSQSMLRIGRNDKGLSERNRTALRRLDDPTERRKLLLLPSRILSLAERSRLSLHRRAIRVQIALAVELLLMAPMRIGQLVMIRIDQHIRLPEHACGLARIVVPDSEIILGDVVEYELPRPTGRLLKVYLTEHHRHLAPPGGQWLFVSKGGAQKNAVYLSSQIHQAASEHLGFGLSPKHFRHFAAKLALEAEPNGLEAVRRLLGHCALSQTKHMYDDLAAPTTALLQDGEIVAKLKASVRP